MTVVSHCEVGGPFIVLFKELTRLSPPNTLSGCSSKNSPFVYLSSAVCSRVCICVESHWTCDPHHHCLFFINITIIIYPEHKPPFLQPGWSFWHKETIFAPRSHSASPTKRACCLDTDWTLLIINGTLLCFFLFIAEIAVSRK